MNRLRLGVLEDKLMIEHTKQAIRCIEKRCRGVHCKMVKVANGDEKTLMDIISRGKLDAVAVHMKHLDKYMTAKKEVIDKINTVAIVRALDNRYVLMTRKKSGKQFAHALIAASSKGIGRQLQSKFDGVNCVITEDDIKQQFDKLMLEQYDGFIAPVSDVIYTGLGKASKVRYRYFEDSEIIPTRGEGAIAILCRKDLEYMEILRKVDNKRVASELTIQAEVSKKVLSLLQDSSCDIGVRANISKDKLDINMYINKDGRDVYISRDGRYSEKDMVIADVLLDVQSNIDRYME